MTTPAMLQYYDLKKQYEDCLLFFRMGDFYEMFEQDAKVAHRILGIALTSRNKNSDTPVALAGIPYHAKEKYLPQLIAAGYKVAIAEQVSDPKLKGIVQREVVRVVTPATLSLESEGCSGGEGSEIIASVTSAKNRYAVSMLSIHTHDWTVCEYDTFADVLAYIEKQAPQELILTPHLFEDAGCMHDLGQIALLNIYCFASKQKSEVFLKKHFQVASLAAFGIDDKPLAQDAATGLLDYLIAHQKGDFQFLKSLKYHSDDRFLRLDATTIRSLDLVYNFATGSSLQGTLFGVLNHTKTPMGKRFLRDQILHPLQDIGQIEQRQEFIDILSRDTALLDSLVSDLKQVSDIDAILNRLALGRALPRDLVNLKYSLKAILSVLQTLEKSGHRELLAILSE